MEHESDLSPRERVLAAAWPILAEYGYAGASMQQIAEAAGITKATLYHHFRDKEDLFIEALAHEFTGPSEALAAEMARAESLEDVIRAWARALFISHTSDFSRLLGDLKRNAAPEVQQAFWSRFERPWSMLEREIRAAMDRGEIPSGDAAFYAACCFGAVIGPVQVQRQGGSYLQLDEAHADQVARLLYAGLLRGSGSRSR